MEIVKQPEFGLTPDILQKLMTAGPGAVISHQVGRALRHKIPLHERTGRGELRQHLTGLADELRGRLAAEDLGPDASHYLPGTTIPKRLRDEAGFLAALLTYMPGLVDDPAERLRLLEEGISWARIAGDGLQEALLRQVCAWRNMDEEKLDDAAADYRKGVEAAASGRHSAMELELRSRLIELLLHIGRLAEAEEETNALLSFINERLDRKTGRNFLSRPLGYLGRIAARREEHADAIRFLEDGLNHADRGIDPVQYMAILFALANSYRDIGESARAIELLVEVGEVSREINRTVFSARAFALTGEIYLEANDPGRAQEAFELAERLVANANLPILRRTIQCRKLPLYLLNDRIEEGIELCRELLEYCTQGPERVKTLRFLGLLLEREGDLTEAEAALRTACDEMPERSLPPGIPLARVLIAQKRDNDARDLLLSLCDGPPERRTRMDDYAEGLELLSGIARRKGEYDDAFELLGRASNVRLTAERSRSELSLRNARILADRNVREWKADLLRNRRERSHEKLAELLTGLEVTHGTLLKIEARLRDNLAGLEPEQIELVVDALKDAIADPATEQAVAQVVSEADALLALRGVDEAFFEALRARWPGLTKKQQQLCGMIRADLKTSQIAHLLGITANAVLTQRKRLRKRMGLSEGENLNDVVMGVE